MGEPYKRIRAKKYPKFEVTGRKEEQVWKKYKFPVTVKEYSAITSIDFSPIKPHDFIVTCSSKIDVYSKATNQPKRSITRVKDTIYSGRFRKDGRLVVAGGDDKVVKVFDANTKSSLRQFIGHKNAVHFTAFDVHGSGVLSGSDDTTVKLWDLPTEKEVCTFHGHEDYIRTGTQSLASAHVVISGSYDHTVKLWDTRTNNYTLSLIHGDPVESVVMLPSGGLCMSSGGNVIKVWDILSGGRLLSSFSNYTKTVTCMCLNGTSTRLIAGSLDRHLKVYDINDYSVVSSMDYPSPILSVALSPDDSHLVVGMADGLLSIKEKESRSPTLQPAKVEKGKAKRYFSSKAPSADDLVVKRPKVQHKTIVDRLLLKFEHRKALNAAVQNYAWHPAYVISVIRELARRNNLKSSLAGKNDEGLISILAFINRHICDPKYTGILTEVANLILDIYSHVIGKSGKVDQIFGKLKRKLDNELEFQRTAFQLLGAMDTLLAASSLYQNPVP